MPNPPQSPAVRYESNLFDKLCLVLTVGVTAGIFLLLVWGFQRGFDFSDEAETLLAAEFPFRVTLRFTETPFYTHWLYRLAGENLFHFRLYGLLLLAVAALYFCRQLIAFFQGILPRDKGTVLCVACTVLASTTCYYCKWFVSPNYYWLCLCGMLVSVGLTLRLIRGGHSLFLYLLLGIFLTITALGRFTSAVPTALLCYAALAAFGAGSLRQRLWGLALTTAAGLVSLMLHMELMAEGIPEVVRIYLRLLAPGNLDEEHEADALFWSVAVAAKDLFREILKRFWETSLVLPPVAAWLWKKRILPFHPGWLLPIILLVPFRLLLKDYGDPSQVLGITLSSGFTGLLLLMAFLPDSASVKRRMFVAGLWLAAFSWAMAFGSNVPVLWHSSRAAIFLVAGIVCLLWLVENPHVIRAASLTLTVGIMLTMASATVHVYRQVSLWDNTEPVQMRGPGTELLLWPEAAAYIASLREATEQSGWKAGTPILDFSGGNPGIAYVLRAGTQGGPRISGGYGKASDSFAQQAIDQYTPEQRRTLWIVTSDNPKRISDDVLLKNFPDFPAGYRKVWTSQTVGRYWEPLWQETLWAPITASSADSSGNSSGNSSGARP